MDESTQSRIITHMNDDHHESLCDYVRYYGGHQCHISNATMTSITLEKITLTYCTRTQEDLTLTIPFEPALSTPSEARARLVAMARTAIISRVPPAKHPSPPLPQFIVLALLWVYVAGYYVNLFVYIPQSVIRLIFNAAIFCHFLEALYALHLTYRTTKTLGIRSLAWSLYVFIYGFTALLLLRHEIRKINAQKSD